MAEDAREMTPAEARDLLRGRHLAIITTNGADGMPHSTPVWYVPDGDSVAIIAEENAVKVRNLRRDPSVSVVIASERRPYRYILYRGKAELLTEGVADYRWRIAERYLGEERARRYLAKGDSQLPVVVIKVSRSRTTTWIYTAEL